MTVKIAGMGGQISKKEMTVSKEKGSLACETWYLIFFKNVTLSQHFELVSPKQATATSRPNHMQTHTHKHLTEYILAQARVLKWCQACGVCGWQTGMEEEEEGGKRRGERGKREGKCWLWHCLCVPLTQEPISWEPASVACSVLGPPLGVPRAGCSFRAVVAHILYRIDKLRERHWHLADLLQALTWCGLADVYG